MKRGRVTLPHLSFRQVSYNVNERAILHELTLQVERGETLVLLGRSGSGKTTALRLINRLLEPSGGEISIGEKNIRELNPIELRRQIGYVIQEFGLMPHWTVEQNVGIVPRLLNWPEQQQKQRVEELLDEVGLSAKQFAQRKPGELSGGQRQRVGVARALAARPTLLLFDEPFGALDPVTRHDMQEQFTRLRDQYNVAAVFVTHDLLEALTLGTRIAVMDEGKLEALVSPDEFWKADTAVTRSFRETLPAALRPH